MIPSILPLGDCALQITLGAQISEAISAEVHALAWRIQSAALPGLIDLVPAYASLTIHYDPLYWDFAALQHAVLALFSADDANQNPRQPTREIQIPVCYEADFGIDLAEVSSHAGLSVQAVIERHAAQVYRVYFLGFTPGFAYLGGLDPTLAMARKPTPRARVPAGSVGIAGAQTGVYSQATPGGWQIVGRTPLTLFDPSRSPPSLLAPGDRVRFTAIDADRFATLARAP